MRRFFQRTTDRPAKVALVAALAALFIGAVPALAHDYTLGNLRIAHPYARPTPPGALPIVACPDVYFSLPASQTLG